GRTGLGRRVSGRQAHGRRPRRAAPAQARATGADPDPPRLGVQGRSRMSSLRARLFVATLAALGFTLVLTISIDAVLTRRQVDKSQQTILSLRADDLARAGRASVSYVNVDKPLGQVRELIQPRAFFEPYVPNVDRPSNGRMTYDGERDIYAYRTLPSRGLLLLRAESLGSGLWHPFLRDLLFSGAVGVVLAAVL